MGGGGKQVTAALARVTAALPAGEERPGQVEMAEAVAGAISAGSHVVVQAGTGTGKSLAYLVPAILSGKKVVVATATKALQDQLANKDLPFLAKHLGVPFSFAVLKGRSNYLCLQKVKELGEDSEQLALADGEDLNALGAELLEIVRWATQSPTGDRAELPFEPTPRGWATVSVGSEECPGANRCPMGEECVAEAARERAAGADVVVVNTHLYGVHLASGGFVLPEHDVVVLDEAHELEDVATATLGLELSAGRFRALARALRGILTEAAGVVDAVERAGMALDEALAPHRDRRLAPARVEGVAAALAGAGNAVAKAMSAVRSVDVEAAERAGAGPRRARALKAATSLADDIAAAATVGAEPAGASGGRRNGGRGRDDAPDPEEAGRTEGGDAPDAEDVGDAPVGAGQAGGGDRTDAGSGRGGSGVDEAAPGEVHDDAGAGDTVGPAAIADGRVAWVEGPPHAPVLKVAPVEVGVVLADRLWSQRPAVLTSATLPPAVPVRVGLPAGSFRHLDVGSPFDYEANALLYCAAHLPDPRHAKYEEALHEELDALIRAAGGRTLALFTSWRAMRAAAEALGPSLPWRVLTQADLPKPALLSAFTEDETSVLFATMGFWQGVDVPGRSLSLVVIDRIPFPRPDEPLTQARRERAGPAAFRLVDLPRAATLLAQGVGRLIRTASDRGVVAVLDSRLARASYRWDLVRALPPMRRTKDRAEVEAFLAGLAAEPAALAD